MVTLKVNGHSLLYYLLCLKFEAAVEINFTVVMHASANALTQNSHIMITWKTVKKFIRKLMYV